jgi:hypothetical protein
MWIFDTSKFAKMSDKAALLLFDPSKILKLIEDEEYTLAFIIALLFPCYINAGILNDESKFEMLLFSYALEIKYYQLLKDPD